MYYKAKWQVNLLIALGSRDIFLFTLANFTQNGKVEPEKSANQKKNACQKARFSK